jgi:CBS domain-containing protein
MKVKEAMQKGVEWLSPDTPVREVARLMRDRDIGAVPIGEDDRLIGMVTDRDIAVKGVADGSDDLGAMTARDVMTAEIHCCSEDDDLATAVRHMEQLQIRRLPVINRSKRMIGMLSLGDISNVAPRDLVLEWAQSLSAQH